MTYSIKIKEQAVEMLEVIRDRRVRRLLISRIDRLADEPDKQGAPLGGRLTGFRSCRAVGQRYRIIYRIDDGNTVVIVAAVGIRRAGARADIYVVAERLARLGLL